VYEFNNIMCVCVCVHTRTHVFNYVTEFGKAYYVHTKPIILFNIIDTFKHSSDKQQYIHIYYIAI